MAAATTWQTNKTTSCWWGEQILPVLDLGSKRWLGPQRWISTFGGRFEDVRQNKLPVAANTFSTYVVAWHMAGRWEHATLPSRRCPSPRPWTTALTRATRVW